MADPKISSEEQFEREIQAAIFTPDALRNSAKRLGEAGAKLDSKDVKDALSAHINQYLAEVDTIETSHGSDLYQKLHEASVRLGTKAMLILGAEEGADSLNRLTQKWSPERVQADQAAEDLVSTRANVLMSVSSQVASVHGVKDKDVQLLTEKVQKATLKELGIEEPPVSERQQEFREAASGLQPAATKLAPPENLTAQKPVIPGLN